MNELIERIVSAAREVCPKVARKSCLRHPPTGRTFAGSHDIAPGIRAEDCVQEWYFCLVDRTTGATYGKREPTREAVVARWEAVQDDKAGKLRAALEAASEAELAQAADYYLKVT